ncbi:MAG: heavy metal translocating P-type ATPase [Bacteroidia bacterium]
MKDCCSTEEPQITEIPHQDHDHTTGDTNLHLSLIAALTILIAVLTLDYGFGIKLNNWVSLIVNGIAYLLAGWGVLVLAFTKIRRGDIFNEFVLMSVATLGAFYIGEYAEGVAVMVFYAIGEWFQESAVNRAKASIKALLDIRPDKVTVLRDKQLRLIRSGDVKINEVIQVKPGEKVGLDGVLLSEKASFNTAALTGESTPDTKYRGDVVLAGMINSNTVVQLKVTSLFEDSKLSKILEMVQEASSRKSQTQLFISRFAKVYTPIVFFMALALALTPYFFVDTYIFNDWLYRALVFLVISCPCALVVSIPLGYFGGIGLASRSGILFKGGNFLDVMTQIDTVVLDKTGTLTKGVFKVEQVVAEAMDEKEFIAMLAILEANSNHPVGQAIIEYAGNPKQSDGATAMEEIPGYGLKGTIAGKEILAGNLKLLMKFGITYPAALEEVANTMVVVSIENEYAGYIIIADQLKDDAIEAINELHRLRIKTVILSGDKQAVVNDVAKKLGITVAYGDLLPEGKVEKVEELKLQGRRIAFVGDGINDAPVLALADAGIAMGGLGSDVAIETADVVIQNDQVGKVASAIKIGKLTRHIVWQNIVLAMGVKALVLTFGAFGVANLWEAVIADVGVALLAILNAIRIQGKKHV